MSIVQGVILGILIGFTVHLLDPESTLGSAILLGIVGAFIGESLANLLIISGFGISVFITAVVGAFGLLIIGRMVRHM